MGKAKIIHEVGKGKYDIEILQDLTRVEAKIAGLPGRIATAEELEAELRQAEAEAKAELDNIQPPFGSEFRRAQNKYDNAVYATKEQEIKILSLNEELITLENRLEVVKNPQRTLKYSVLCVDGTEKLTEDVGLVEISTGGVGATFIKGGGQGREEKHTASWEEQDGVIQPILSASSSTGDAQFGVFFNLAMYPAWAKWRPTFRTGVVKRVVGEDDEEKTLDVGLDKAEYTGFPYLEGSAVLNNVLPINVNQTDFLSEAPINYPCKDVFEVNDLVLVRFKDQIWDTPEVVGFTKKPRFCGTALFAGGGGLDIIDKVDIVKGGTATEHGNLSGKRHQLAATSNGDKAVFGGGNQRHVDDVEDPLEFIIETLDTISIKTGGASLDYGNLAEKARYLAAVSNGDKAVFGGGEQNRLSTPEECCQRESCFCDRTECLEDCQATCCCQNCIRSGACQEDGHEEECEDYNEEDDYDTCICRAQDEDEEEECTDCIGDCLYEEVGDEIFDLCYDDCDEFADQECVDICTEIACDPESSTPICWTEDYKDSGYFGTTDFTIKSLHTFSILDGGNAVGYGNLSLKRSALAAVSDGDKAVFGGGGEFEFSPPSPCERFVGLYTLDTFSILTGGAATDYGSLLSKEFSFGIAAVSDGDKAVFGGWEGLQKISILTGGTAIDHGELSKRRSDLAAASSGDKALFGGGHIDGDVLDTFSIKTGGTATDHGQLSTPRRGLAAVSN